MGELTPGQIEELGARQVEKFAARVAKVRSPKENLAARAERLKRKYPTNGAPVVAEVTRVVRGVVIEPWHGGSGGMRKNTPQPSSWH